MNVAKHRGTESFITVATLVAVLTFMDERHATASEVQDLTNAIQSDRIERVEYHIEDAERRIKQIVVVPVAERTPYQVKDLLEAQYNKEMHLRKLKRINGTD